MTPAPATATMEHPIPEAFRPFYEDQAKRLLNHFLEAVRKPKSGNLESDPTFIRTQKEVVDLLAAGIAIRNDFF